VLRLLDLLARDDVEIRELVALISSDPAFSAQILRVANSPLFGFRSRKSTACNRRWWSWACAACARSA
jgi:HD-like signal output (HDOD) protein